MGTLPVAPTLARGMLLVKAVLPLPPTVNGAYQLAYIRRKGTDETYRRLCSTDALKNFKKQAAPILLSEKYDTSKQRWDVINAVKKTPVPLRLKILFYFSEWYCQDLDGSEKYALDAICKHIGIDDKYVIRKITDERVDATNPRCELSLSVLHSTPLGGE